VCPPMDCPPCAPNRSGADPGFLLRPRMQAWRSRHDAVLLGFGICGSNQLAGRPPVAATRETAQPMCINPTTVDPYKDPTAGVLGQSRRASLRDLYGRPFSTRKADNRIGALINWPIQSVQVAQIPRTTAIAQVFGRRHDEPFHALWQPACKKRQGTKSREVCGRRVPRALWGLCRGFRLAEAGLKRLPRSACREAWSLASV